MNQMDYQGAIKVLKKIEEEERNWRSGLRSIGTLLEAAMAADAQLRGSHDRLRDLNVAIKDAEARAANAAREAQAAEERATAATDEAARVVAALNERRHDLDRLGGIERLDEQIHEREQKLKDLESSIDLVKKKFA